MNRITALLLAFMLVLTLTACGDDTPEADSTPSNTTTTTPPNTTTEPQTTAELSNDPSIPTVSVGEPYQFDGYDYIILDMQDGKILLLSNYKNMGQMPYHSAGGNVTWENSEIRQFLNNDYYNLFSEEARAQIVETKVISKDNPWYGTDGGNDTNDYLFLLSIEEIIIYFGDSGQYVNQPSGIMWIDDEFNTERLAKDDYGAVDWWLRSSGENNECAAYIISDGNIHVAGNPADMEFDGFSNYVRPAFWINLPSDMPIFAITPPQTLAPLVTTIPEATTTPPDTTTAPPANTTTAPPANTTTTATTAPPVADVPVIIDYSKVTMTLDNTSYIRIDSNQFITITVKNITSDMLSSIPKERPQIELYSLVTNSNYGTYGIINSGDITHQMIVPHVSGNYEMRLYSSRDGTLLVSIPFTVDASAYSSNEVGAP